MILEINAKDNMVSGLIVVNDDLKKNKNKKCISKFLCITVFCHHDAIYFHVKGTFLLSQKHGRISIRAFLRLQCGSTNAAGLDAQMNEKNVYVLLHLYML
jgi:hypothetical protein